MRDIEEQTFNDDLLLTEKDRRLARISFPEVYFALDFPELRDLFAKYDERSNHAKRKRRRVGVIAIGMGAIALIGASAEPLYHEHLDARWLHIVGSLLAGIGVVSIVLGWFGVLTNKSKREWLRDRLVTERLRQFHFQMLICRLQAILGSADGQAISEFIDLRKQLLAGFRLDHEGHLPGKLKDVLDDNDEEDFWLHEIQPVSPESNRSPLLAQLCAAYRLLRFGHQIQYANYKLRDEGIAASVVQMSIFRQIVGASIAIVFVVHLMIALSLTSARFTIATTWSWPHVVVVWTAILALGARALEEGLQPTREVERYTRYRSVMARLLFNFDHSDDPAEKIRIMRETERVIYQEMRAFLRTNDEAQFVL